MTIRIWLAATAATCMVAGTVSAADKEPTKPVYGFASLKSLPTDAAKAKSAAWLKTAGKFDAAAFDAIWANESRTILDRTADSLALADTSATKALAEARTATAPAPAQAPAFFKDAKLDPFFRANVAAAYAKALTAKNAFEESLDALRVVQPELVVEPAAYFFHKAVAEHKLTLREQASGSIVRLLDDVTDAPDRYKMVATLMFFDMQNWSKDDKDLANIGRLMDNSGRRLDLARGGPQTQDIQKKIVFRLDEVIKDLEQQLKGGT